MSESARSRTGPARRRDDADPQLQSQLREIAHIAAALCSTPISTIVTADGLTGRWAHELPPEDLTDADARLVVPIHGDAGTSTLGARPTIVGELSVGDTVDRCFSDEQVAALNLLARQAGRLICGSQTPVETQRLSVGAEAVRQRYRTVTASMRCGVVVHSPDGSIRFANPAAEQTLGLSIDQMRGLTPLDPSWDCVHEDGTPFPGHEHPASVALRDHIEMRDVVMGVRRADGARRWILVTASPLSPIGEIPSGVVATFVDITTERDLREQLARSLALLRRSTQEHAALASAISHDLATPAAAVRILTDLLPQLAEGAVRDQAIASARQGAHRVEALISELGVMSARLHSSDVPQRLRADLRGLVRRATVGSEHPVSLSVPDHPVWADVDPLQVERIVDNLIGNAHKHTPAGSTITVTLFDDGEAAVVTVEDDGPGVPDDRREAVFEPFTRLSTDTPGDGIGLYLVREFAAFHGGRAWCEARPGGGSRFVVTLPTRSEASPPTG